MSILLAIFCKINQNIQETDAFHGKNRVLRIYAEKRKYNEQFKSADFTLVCPFECSETSDNLHFPGMTRQTGNFDFDRSLNLS
ncbi:MAG: hypothetical protein LBE91_12340 [Tannerella sp.]|jgi:hypothetical protein|nr:hypothetical protein [Tannerella sp.]